MADNVEIPNNSPEFHSWASVDGSCSWVVEQNWTYHKAYDWILNVAESILIDEARIKKDPCKVCFESFGVADSKFVCSYDLNKYEKLNVVDKVSFSTSFIKKFAESIAFTESPCNWPSLPFNEAFSIFDTLIRPANGIVSDMIFESGNWDIDSMQSAMLKGKHAGYECFKPFIYGDYTYDKALFRTVLEASNADRAIIEQFKIEVDVPDLNDRGSEEVTDAHAGRKVYFNKGYHIAPEVTITMRTGVSGVPVVPVIEEITEEYFTMYLMNSVTGERETGTFIWNAIGY